VVDFGVVHVGYALHKTLSLVNQSDGVFGTVWSWWMSWLMERTSWELPVCLGCLQRQRWKEMSAWVGAAVA